MASNLSFMIDKIEEKLLLSTYVTDPENIHCGELDGKESMADTMFPRLEFNMHAEDNFNYNSNIHIVPLNYFLVQGWLRWEDGYRKGKERLLATVEFFRQTQDNIWAINSDFHLKIPGRIVIPGFEQVYPLMHASVYHEMDLKHTSFAFSFAIQARRKF